MLVVDVLLHPVCIVVLSSESVDGSFVVVSVFFLETVTDCLKCHPPLLATAERERERINSDDMQVFVDGAVCRESQYSNQW